jgi:integrase
MVRAQALHEWTDSEMKGLVAAAEELARQPQARYDYSALLRTALATGLRQSELLGLKWCDIDLTEGELGPHESFGRGRSTAGPGGGLTSS